MKTRLMALVALMLPIGSTVAQAPQGPPPALVEVAEALEDAVASTTWVPGTVVSRNDARIAAELAARATWVAEVGTHVAPGEPLARLEDRALRLQLADNEAAVARLEAQLALEESQLKRWEELASNNNAAADELDQARSQREVMRQNLRAAQIARERLEYDLERTIVAAPYGGRVVERLVQPGEYVNPGAAIVRLVDTEHMEVRARAPIASARFIDDGMIVSVRDDYVEAKNAVRTVIPVGDERSRMIEVRVALAQDDWIIGAPVKVALPTSAVRQLVAIPRDALVLRGGETFVYRVDGEDKAERVSVETGIGIGAMVEVIGEIAPGDRLVVRGGERLRPGQPLTIADSETAASGP